MSGRCVCVYCVWFVFLHVLCVCMVCVCLLCVFACGVCLRGVCLCGVHVCVMCGVCVLGGIGQEITVVPWRSISGPGILSLAPLISSLLALVGGFPAFLSPRADGVTCPLLCYGSTRQGVPRETVLLGDCCSVISTSVQWTLCEMFCGTRAGGHVPVTPAGR